MKKGSYIITYDVGTTAIKTCLFFIDEKIELIESTGHPYELALLDNDGAEQNPLDWWEAMCESTKKILKNSNISQDKIAGISFCSQMQGLVLVDKEGNPLRPAMSYMDGRAETQLKKGLAHGIQIAGCNIFKLIKSLYITKAVAASVKDPIWKYKWVEENEPEIFEKVYKWLDVKEFLICKCTDKFIMTRDSAFATLLYDVRKGHETFSKSMCKMFGVNPSHLPDIISSTDSPGGLTETSAKMLGLKTGTPVFGGGGDASLIGIGSGAIKKGSTHIYNGTSGWVSTVVCKPIVDTKSMIAAIVGAMEGHYNYFAELETAGKCLEWVKDHLALDEIGVFLEKKNVTEPQEAVYKTLYDYMMDVIIKIPAGSGGVIFTPWLRGNRCPFEDSHARGMFFNIDLDTGKTELIRSVLEGVCYHMRWMLEAQDSKIKTSSSIRFVGGGALSSLTCQILADILNRKVETVEGPQNVGAAGAAIVVAIGLGILCSFEDADKLIPASRTFIPNSGNRIVYDTGFEVFKRLYKNNKKNFKLLR